MFRTALAVAVLSLLPFTACAQDKGTAEQKAVRVYLKENLPSGKFEEIKWGRSQIGKTDPTKAIIRFKYRTANRLGAMEVSDDGFRIAKGKVIEWFKGEGGRFGELED